MTEAAANRLAGICAMLFAPLLIIGFGVIVGFSPLIDDPAAEVATYYRELNFGRALFGEWLELLSFIGLLVFAARIAHLVRDSSGAWLGRLELAAATSVSAIAFVGIAILIAGTHIGSHGDMEPQQYVLLNTIRNSTHWISSMLLGLWMLAMAGVILNTRLFPRWLGWASVGIGIVLLVLPAAPALQGAVDIAQLMFMVWLFIVGAILLARPTRPLSEGR